jgi:hypothetical protein
MGVAEPSSKPRFFLSYSSREDHVQILRECLEASFKLAYEMDATPSALESGASQRDQITKMIEGCSFGVVVLDGLRPNVVFEYGILHALERPVILMKELRAEVDIKGFFRGGPPLELTAPSVDVDLQFSNVKDVNYATWDRFSVRATLKTIRDEFKKKRNEIEPYIEIPEGIVWDNS